MRKKSHIALASYLLHSEGMTLLTTHKKAFYLGNILPDCVPSFITRRHCIKDTFSVLKKELSLLIEHYDYTKGITAYFCRHLGIILHYVADYFTFPHNHFYPGNLKDHCDYEEILKQEMRQQVKLEIHKRSRSSNLETCSVESICQEIKKWHEAYSFGTHNTQTDCTFILSVCHSITDHILAFAESLCGVRLCSAL